MGREDGALFRARMNGRIISVIQGPPSSSSFSSPPMPEKKKTITHISSEGASCNLKPGILKKENRSVRSWQVRLKRGTWIPFFLSATRLYLLIPPLPSKHGRGAVRLDDSGADGRELARQHATNNERACKLKQTKPLSAPPKAGSLPPATPRR